jgi:hypothetical protein
VRVCVCACVPWGGGGDGERGVSQKRQEWWLVGVVWWGVKKQKTKNSFMDGQHARALTFIMPAIMGSAKIGWLAPQPMVALSV